MAFYVKSTPLDHGKLERGARPGCLSFFSIGSVCADVGTVPNVGNWLNNCVPCKKITVVVAFGIMLLQFSNSFIHFVMYCLRMQSYRNALYQILTSCNQ